MLLIYRKIASAKKSRYDKVNGQYGQIFHRHVSRSGSHGGAKGSGVGRQNPSPVQGSTQPNRKRRAIPLVTGCTEARILDQNHVSKTRVGMIMSSVTGWATDSTALRSTHSQRSSSVVLSGCASLITSTTPTTAFPSARIKKLPPRHRAHEVAGLIVPNAVPFFTIRTFCNLVIPAPRGGFGFEKPMPFHHSAPKDGERKGSDGTVGNA